MQKHCHLAKYQSNMCYWKIHNHEKKSVSESQYIVILKPAEIWEQLLKNRKESRVSDHVVFLLKRSWKLRKSKSAKSPN